MEPERFVSQFSKIERVARGGLWAGKWAMHFLTYGSRAKLLSW
jgi:hypothetical protein